MPVISIKQYAYKRNKTGYLMSVL